MEIKILTLLIFQYVYFHQISAGEYLIDSNSNENGNFLDNKNEINAEIVDMDYQKSFELVNICDKSQFKCSDGTCIDNEAVCDKTPDCFDGTDEGNICLSISGSKKRAYGEFCNRHLKCNSTNWFRCSTENACNCAKPDEMSYDSEKGKCLALVNEICKFEIGKVGHLEQYALYEMVDCIPNANCSSEGVCTCLKDFEESNDGFCTEKANFTQKCTSNSNCKESLFLDCIDGSCQCSENSTWSFEANVCVGLAGKECIQSKCTENSDCVSGLCVCSKGFYNDKNNTCSAKKSNLGECENSEECLGYEHFICSKNGQCVCNPEYSIWRSDFRACVGIPENKCINGQCIAGATCYRSQFEDKHRNYIFVDPYENIQRYDRWGNPDDIDGLYIRDEDYDLVAITTTTTTTESPILTKSPDLKNFQRKGICKCSDKRNFLHSEDKSKCWPGYAQECSSEVPCDSDFFVCKNGKCACRAPLHQEFSRFQGTCQSILGGPCKLDQIPNSCSGNLECVSHSNPLFNSSRCECKKGYVQDTLGNCKLAYGQKCNFTSTCENVTPLECVNNLCVCPDELTRYDEDSRRCLSVVGATCTTAEDNCVEYARCNQGHKSLKGRCKCIKGYTNRSQNGVCEFDGDLKFLKG